MAHEQSRTFVSKYLNAKEPLSFEASLTYLRQAAGSNRGASRLAGLSKSAVQDWVSGRRHPSRASQERVRETVRDMRTPDASDEQLKLKMFNTDRRRTRGKHERRPVDAEHLDLAPGTMAKARMVWVTTGDADAAYTTFVKGIGKSFYRGSLANAADLRIDEDDDARYEGLSSDYGMSII